MSPGNAGRLPDGGERAADRDPAVPPLLTLLYEDTVRSALLEDLGVAGDRTTDALGLGDRPLRAALVSRSPGRIAGLDVATHAFRLLDRATTVDVRSGDGSDVGADEPLAVVTCSARAMLGAERTALNLLSLLSGCATLTRDLVAAVSTSGARIVPTRKTIPGLRTLQRYAVSVGGGFDHRFGLDDAILLKDNHLLLAGGLRAAVDLARRRQGHLVKLQVEVDTLDQLDDALDLGVEAVLLDNMTLGQLTEAVRRGGGRAVLEASGGIRPDTAAPIAATGVDLLSVGWLTHSPTALDIGLDLLA